MAKKKPDTVYSLRKQVKQLQAKNDVLRDSNRILDQRTYEQNRELVEFRERDERLKLAGRQVGQLMDEFRELLRAEFIAGHSKIDEVAFNKACNDSDWRVNQEHFRVPCDNRQSKFIHYLLTKMNEFSFELY